MHAAGKGAEGHTVDYETALDIHISGRWTISRWGREGEVQPKRQPRVKARRSCMPGLLTVVFPVAARFHTPFPKICTALSRECLLRGNDFVI